MSTDSSTGGEWAAFTKFVVTKLGDNLNGLSLEQSVAEFRAYQRDLEALRAKVERSIAQVDQGRVHLLDDAKFWTELDRRFDELGIPE